jgi:hypothetical protein
MLIAVSCKNEAAVISDNVEIEIFTYQTDGQTKASAMPKIRSNSKLNDYSRRYDYLLINLSKIHSPQKAKKREKIWSLFPDTIELKNRYLKEFAIDKKLERYFQRSSNAINNSNPVNKPSFSTEELMEVASKFFYCDQVFPDTTIQSHICIGLNGINEAKWKKDYVLLEAFCYEAIFYNLDKEYSEIDETYSFEKFQACEKLKPQIKSLSSYLNEVKTDLFERMKNNNVLKEKLLEYYYQNKTNLAFEINSVATKVYSN